MRAIFLLVPLLMLSCGTTSHETHSLSPEAFAARLHEPGAQLIDARTPSEFNSGHLANATNLDQNAGQVQASSGRLDKSKPVLLYCASGRRSAAAREYLIEQGFTDVVDLQGGIHAWTAAGKPLGD